MAAIVVATVIFIAMFVVVVLDKIERQYVTLGCGILTLIFVFGVCMRSMDAVWETLNLRTIFTMDFWHVSGNEVESSAGINWATIIFIAGMMIMVEGMARVGFFRWMCMEIAKLVHYRPIPIFIAFMTMSFVLAMFIDSITVILFLAAVTVELSRLLKFNPVPMIMSEIFCANLGGSATMCGDPPNIIIGTSFGYSFADFIENTGLMAMLSMVMVVIYFYFVFRKEFTHKVTAEDLAAMPEPKSAITDKAGFIINTLIFVAAVVMLVSHAETGLTVAFIGVVVAAVTLIAAGKHALWVLKRVDYKTLLFFVGLFIVVGGLEQTGALEIVAHGISVMSGGNAIIMVVIIIWISAIASAFIDNIPFAATMIPVIRNLAATHISVHLDVLAWALAMGTDIGGSATPIGASANVVGTSAAAKAGHPIGWGEYCKKIVPATVMVLIICTVYICVRYL